MKVGDKWKLFIPSDLTYGPRGAGGQIVCGEGIKPRLDVELPDMHVLKIKQQYGRRQVRSRRCQVCGVL